MTWDAIGPSEHRRLCGLCAGAGVSAFDDGPIANGRKVLTADIHVNGEAAPFTEPLRFAVAAFGPDMRITR